MTDRMTWQNPRVLRLLVLVFVAGGLSGAFAFRMWRIMVHRDAAVSVLVSLNNKQSSLEMRWCLDCHRNPEKYVRPRQFVTKMGYVPVVRVEKPG